MGQQGGSGFPHLSVPTDAGMRECAHDGMRGRRPWWPGSSSVAMTLALSQHLCSLAVWPWASYGSLQCLSARAWRCTCVYLMCDIHHCVIGLAAPECVRGIRVPAHKAVRNSWHVLKKWEPHHCHHIITTIVHIMQSTRPPDIYPRGRLSVGFSPSARRLLAGWGWRGPAHCLQDLQGQSANPRDNRKLGNSREPCPVGSAVAMETGGS